MKELAFLSFAVCALASSVASAADLPSRKLAPPLPVVAVDDYQPFQIRLRATALIPDGSFTIFDRYGIVPAATGIVSGAPGGKIFGAGVDVSNSVIPEIDLSYYFNKNFAVETIAGYTRHKLTATGPLANIPVGSTNLLPVSLLAQYHVTDLGAFQPYIGVGVTWAVPYAYGPGNGWTPLVTALGFTGFNSVRDLQIGQSVGVAGQIGFDYMITPNIGINVDLKRIMAQPTAYATIYNTALNQNIYVRVQSNLDPWLASVGATFRFGGASPAPVLAKY
ncbi:OmpW family outer membrane protein [Methylocystis sp. JR02]|uniref:OmpW/AlkL family protein n=1 Tax=Methylocystis sp. JR02 TaxID=3046284 RepID=UPI0024BAAE4C|nr:OmpW family outer membrane protein [Methylocystis sp. JR02]MDJ0450642.1 OmpW family outer membrane protein [Methylocystis sp. JR02]